MQIIHTHGVLTIRVEKTVFQTCSEDSNLTLNPTVCQEKTLVNHESELTIYPLKPDIELVKLYSLPRYELVVIVGKEEVTSLGASVSNSDFDFEEI